METMDSHTKSSLTKRFVVEDSITKVTSDGEPHEMMTIIAGLSGLLAAIVILIILAILVTYKKNQRESHCKRCLSAMHTTESIEKLPCGGSSLSTTTRYSVAPSITDSNRTSLSTIYTRTTSIPDNNSTDGTQPNSPSPSSKSSPPLQSRHKTAVSIISMGNLEGNLNKAFVGSELNLSSSLHKKKKKTHWSDEVEARHAKETAIDIKRY